MSDYIGIDYGHGTTNVDLSNGIRYGVISQYSVLQAWADSSEPVYPENDQSESDADEDCEPIGWTYEGEGYLLEDAFGNTEIFVLKSPFYTFAQFCSPCAPGAGNLNHPMEDGVKCYCLGHDWFDDQVATYPVYRVSDGERVLSGMF